MIDKQLTNPKISEFVDGLIGAHFGALINRPDNRPNQSRQYFEDEDEMSSIAEEFAMPEKQGRARRNDDVLEHEGYQGPIPASVKSRTVEGI